MRLLVSLNMFKPMLKNASKMTTPIQELRIPRAQAGKVESAVGDIAEFTTKANGNNIESACKKLFSSYEKFKDGALTRLKEHRTGVPEKLFEEVEKSVSSNEFELTKVITGYYSKLNECKTLEEVAAIYPEFAHLNIDITNELRTLIKSSIPESVCKKARHYRSKEDRLNYIIKYMEDATNNCVKGWKSYPDIIRIQNEIAVEIANGKFLGSPDLQAGLKFFANKEPLRFFLVNKKDRDAVILSYLKQFYLEGKSMQNIVPEVVKERTMTPEIINIHGFHWSNPSYINFRNAATSIEKEAGEFKAISRLTTGEINSAVMKQAWTKSALRADMAAETRFGKGWTNVKSILSKRKGIETNISSPDEMINRYLLNLFKTNKQGAVEKNPFLKFENPETDKTAKVKRFINSLYHVNQTTTMERLILKSEEFRKFKSQFDIEGMKESIKKLEDQYINLFFKYFWVDARKERFASALNEVGITARENIQISDSILMQALKEIV